MTDESVFAAALAIGSPSARAAYLDRACANNPALRKEIEELLAAHAASNPLDRPANLAFTGAYQPEAHPPVAVIGERIGPYRLLQQIGEGGMGTVFMAEQTEPIRRLVALKVIKPGMDSVRVIARFEAERQALALMDHPNIAKVLDAGTTSDGRPFFVMELVKGVPITRYCDELNLSIRERLELFVPVCQAVQHAHQKGIIHRDIKPSNVLVAVQDGKPVVKIIDFGVAKALHQKLTDRTLYTEFGAVIGTLEYMAPEQAELSPLDVDTRADVYALGVLLYELLTGTTPIDAATIRKAAFAEALRLIREVEPPRPSTRLSTATGLPELAAKRRTDPRRLGTEVRGDLDWVVMRCLEKDRTRRYATADALAADVARYLTDRPVEACPPSRWYRVRKFARRNRVALLACGAFAAVLLAATGVSLAFGMKATRAEEEAQLRRREADDHRVAAEAGERAAREKEQEVRHQRDLIRRDSYIHAMNLVQAAWDADHLDRVDELLNEQIPRAGEADLRGFEWHFWRRRVREEVAGHALPVGPRGGQPVLALDGTRVASGRTIWDVASGTELTRTPGPDAAEIVFINPDGRHVVVAEPGDPADPRPRRHMHGSWNLSVRDAQTGRTLRSLVEKAWGFVFSADGSRVATGIMLDNGLPLRAPRARWVIRDVATGDVLLEPKDEWAGFGVAAFSPNGERFVAQVEGDETASDANGKSYRLPVVRVWNLKTREVKPERTLVVGGNHVLAIAVAADNRLAVAALHGPIPDYRVAVWDLATGKETTSFPVAHQVTDLMFDPNGNDLAVWSPYGGRNRVILWDSRNRLVRKVIKGHRAGVESCAFARDSRFVSVDGKGHLKVWDLSPRNPYPATATVAHNVAFSADGIHLAYLELDSDRKSYRLKVCTAEGTEVVVAEDAVVPRISGNIDLYMSADGRRVAVADFNGDLATSSSAIRVWDVGTKKVLLHVPARAYFSALSPDGGYLAAIVWDDQGPRLTDAGRLRVWDVRTGAEVPLTISLSQLGAVRSSPDGRSLAVAGSFPTPDGAGKRLEVRVLDTATWRERFAAHEHQGSGVFRMDVVWSPDSRRLVVAGASHGERGGCAVLDATTGRHLVSLLGFAGSPAMTAGFAFAPDGRRIASLAFDDGRIVLKLWDAETGRELLEIKHDGFQPGAVMFRANGNQILTSCVPNRPGLPRLAVWDATPLPDEPKR